MSSNNNIRKTLVGRKALGDYNKIDFLYGIFSYNYSFYIPNSGRATPIGLLQSQ